MLSPSVDDVLRLLTQSLNEIFLIDRYAVTTNNILIGKLAPDPQWLPSVRNRVAMLGQAGSAWLSAKPGIWAPVLSQFASYNATFAAVADEQKNGKLNTAAQWLPMLNEFLLPALSECVTATNAADAALTAQLRAFSAIQPLLENSINTAWAALAHEEQQMVDIANQLGQLQELVGSLQDSVTVADISTGETVVGTTVTTLYNIAAEAGESFSFLSMTESAITVGRFFFDVISHTAEVGDALEQIAALQIRASEEAQAAAGTKMVLRLLYNLQATFRSIVDIIPQLTTMWRNEKEKVRDAAEALDAGADPRTLFDLQTVSIAAASWQTIAAFALAIPALKSESGKPVVLNPQQPM